MGERNWNELASVDEQRRAGHEFEDALGQEADQRQHGECGDQTVAVSLFPSGEGESEEHEQRRGQAGESPVKRHLR